MNLLAVFGLAEPERTARVREARMATLLLFGSRHTLTAALVGALAELDALAALPRRRLLAVLAHVLPVKAAP